ncbi:hypothetical protein [Chryseobacterium sp. Mn2064]|uniref:hypothetical protein n=1 Tax=Chryseobacterium sp. Mn2064 TaxID=3395263 RepID=UPI003BBBECEB
MKKNIKIKMKKLNKYIIERANAREKFTEKAENQFEFLLHSAYINAFNPVTDLSFIVDELKALIKHFKQRKINQKQLNKRSYETV